MKNKEEVLKRAIVLLAFCDRCALEKKVIDGKSRNLNEREFQRTAIYNWLVKMGYKDFISGSELEIFNISITEETNEKILVFQKNYECLEPLLWSLGLIDELSDYNDFVLDDFHPVLQFGRNHSLDNLLKKCKNIDESIICDYRDIAMLWYWRCLENRTNRMNSRDLVSVIHKVFGDKYVDLLYKYNIINDEFSDFMFNEKEFNILNCFENDKLAVISERRFYAFEWLCSDADWDSVDLVC